MVLKQIKPMQSKKILYILSGKENVMWYVSVESNYNLQVPIKSESCHVYMKPEIHIFTLFCQQGS